MLVFRLMPAARLKLKSISASTVVFMNDCQEECDVHAVTQI